MQILEERLLPIAEALAQVTATSWNQCTTHRWRKNGIGGIKLETVNAGGRRILTSVEAVKRFFAATSGLDLSQPSDNTPSDADAKTARIAQAKSRIQSALS